MKKSLWVASLLCLLVQFSPVASAKIVDNWFAGWTGKKQQNRYLDVGSWHHCYNSRGGSCGSISLTVGRSKCTTWTVNVGIDFDLKKRIPGLSISASGSRSWTACNTRSETITCSPKKGWKGRPEIIATARWGKMRFRGKQTIYRYRKINDWNGAVHKACNIPGFYRAKIQTIRHRIHGKLYRVTCNPRTQDVNRWWPEKRWSQCGYRRG